MRRVPAHNRRVLAIDPISKGFGFAILEGPERLVDWGIIHVKVSDRPARRSRIDRLLERFRPTTVVLEDLRRNGRRARARRVSEDIHEVAAARSVCCKLILKSQVRRVFAGTASPRKHDIAESVAARFPELTPRLPRRRKPWMSEAENMAIFDSVALALAFLPG